MKKRFIVGLTILGIIFFSTGCKEKEAETNIIRVNMASEPDSLDPWLRSFAVKKIN